MLLLGSFYAESAFACSLVNAVASTANSVTVSGYYLLVSGVLGGLIICIELLQRRRPLILAVTMGLLAFHPRWTMAPVYGPDCSFQNVEASQFVLATICLVLGYQIFGILRSHRSGS
jgi:hypothetical protein